MNFRVAYTIKSPASTYLYGISADLVLPQCAGMDMAGTGRELG